ncbi:MAG TPA: sigma-70 family RNA polymerase sigma factor [Roseiflexaceae bacterium]|nr:sigma-70 family RNA polymerase sigma factor [Roseiflexaceae bacterium]
MIATLDQQLGWNLDEPARLRYQEELVGLLSEPCPEELLRQTVQCYHVDHELVQTLRDANHPSHYAAWEDMRLRVLMTLKSKGFGDYTNGSVDFDDLVQIALVDLSASLVRFRFASRLATWLHVVALNSARRTLRTQRATRRAATTVPLEHPVNEDLAIPSTAQPESLADYQLLLAMIATGLRAQNDERLLPIFQLWALDDQRLADIGNAMRLSKSRVSTLLEEARTVLRGYLRQHHWVDDHSASANEATQTQK